MSTRGAQEGTAGVRGTGVRGQVIVELGSYLARTASKIGGTWLSRISLVGFSAGLMVMYGTALLVNF